MAEWWRNSGRLSVLGWRTWPGTDSRPRPELGTGVRGGGATPVALKATAKSSFLTTIFTFPYLLVIYGAISSLFFSRPLICGASAV